MIQQTLQTTMIQDNCTTYYDGRWATVVGWGATYKFDGSCILRKVLMARFFDAEHLSNRPIPSLLRPCLGRSWGRQILNVRKNVNIFLIKKMKFCFWVLCIYVYLYIYLSLYIYIYIYISFYLYIQASKRLYPNHDELCQDEEDYVLDEDKVFFSAVEPWCLLDIARQLRCFTRQF